MAQSFIYCAVHSGPTHLVNIHNSACKYSLVCDRQAATALRSCKTSLIGLWNKVSGEHTGQDVRQTVDKNHLLGSWAHELRMTLQGKKEKGRGEKDMSKLRKEYSREAEQPQQTAKPWTESAEIHCRHQTCHLFGWGTSPSNQECRTIALTERIVLVCVAKKCQLEIQWPRENGPILDSNWPSNSTDCSNGNTDWTKMLW